MKIPERPVGVLDDFTQVDLLEIWLLLLVADLTRVVSSWSPKVTNQPHIGSDLSIPFRTMPTSQRKTSW
jgi:hypothetical protein